MPYRHPIFSFLGFVVTLITLLASRGITSAERIDFTVPIGNIIGGQTFFAPVPELPAEPLLVITIRGISWARQGDVQLFENAAFTQLSDVIRFAS